MTTGSHTPFVLCGKEKQICKMYQEGFKVCEEAVSKIFDLK